MSFLSAEGAQHRNGILYGKISIIYFPGKHGLSGVKTNEYNASELPRKYPTVLAGEAKKCRFIPFILQGIRSVAKH